MLLIEDSDTYTALYGEPTHSDLVAAAISLHNHPETLNSIGGRVGRLVAAVIATQECSELRTENIQTEGE